MKKGDVGLHKWNAEAMCANVIIAILSVENHVFIELSYFLPAFAANEEGAEVGMRNQRHPLRYVEWHSVDRNAGYEGRVVGEQGAVEPFGENHVIIED